MNSQKVTLVTGYTLHLTREEANAFYNDVYRLSRDMRRSEVARYEYPNIFAVYDELARAGVDGTG